MRRIFAWCLVDLKRGLASLDANKLFMAPFAFFIALAVLDYSVDTWCHEWPNSLRCSVRHHRTVLKADALPITGDRFSYHSDNI